MLIQASLSNPVCGFIRSIVIRIEPLVPGHIERAVVTFEIAVMELMVKVSSINNSGVANLQLFKPGMGKGGAQAAAVKV